MNMASAVYKARLKMISCFSESWGIRIKIKGKTGKKLRENAKFVEKMFIVGK